jgi:hypothetical protein
MSEIDVLADLETLLPDIPAALDNRRLGDTLIGSTAKLRNADHQIDRIEAVLELAADIKFGETTAHAEMVEELRDAVYETGEALEAAETADALSKAVYAYENDLNKALSSLDRALVTHWRALASRQFDPMIAIGNLLARIDPDSDLGAALAACGTRARTAADQGGGRALLTQVRKLLAEQTSLQQRRRDELGEGDVANFVNALAEDRATLATLTPVVTAWLDENHALDKLKIRP